MSRKTARIIFSGLSCIAACSCCFWAAPPGHAPDQIGCAVFPAHNVWNAPVDRLPVDANSDAFVHAIGAETRLHPDFGTGLWHGSPIGIPYAVVDGKQPKLPVRFDYAQESDPAGYPIPADVPLERNGSGDSHVLVVDKDSCTLYELFAASRQPNGTWRAGSGAIYNLRSNALRPAGWTSADAAGLPIFPGLVRYAEVASGEIRHALRFTAPRTRNEYIWPARHQASRLSDRQYPPMGQRFRLKASVDISRYSRDAQVVMRTLKIYGMFLADNGGAWFLSGAPDERWSDRVIDDLKSLHGSDFEAVDEFSLREDNDSGAISAPASPGAVSTASVIRIEQRSKADLKTPGEFFIIIDSPPGKAPAALQFELSVPPVIAIKTADITAGEAVHSAGKSLTCASRPTKQRLSQYACVLAGGQEPIANGTIAVIQCRFQWNPQGAPVRMAISDILGVTADLKRILFSSVEATIEPSTY